VSERAAIWRRVSSDRQDEANQIPDTERYCIDHNYTVAERYTVHAKSAYHGRHQGDLDRALADMRAGKYAVLVVWHSDRIERRPGKALLDLLAEFQAAGGRVESVQEPTLGQLDVGGQVTTFLAGLMNHEKSAHISEQVKLANDRIKVNGGNPGRAMWGYVSTGEKYARSLTPTDEGRAIVPGIFQRVADGDSLQKVADWVQAEYGIIWWPRRIAWMIRNPAYRGHRQDANGVTVHKCDALVDAALWLRANNALTVKPGKRGPANGASAMLTSILFCGECKDESEDGEITYASPMYRIRPRAGYVYYRCSGKAGRKACGHMVRLAETDAAVTEWLSMASQPRKVAQRVEGNSHYAELAETQLELAELPKRGLSDDEEDAERSRLRAERNRLESLPETPDRIVMVETGETVGEHFASLDDAARRAMMLADGIKVWSLDSTSTPLAIEFTA
jgi:DNA invertase Pin-like site-specific DNA recombinase